MDKSVVYAIAPKGYNTRPGYVLDEGIPGQKVRVKVYWSWPGDDDDWLNPEPPLHDERSKSDIKMVETSDVLGLWPEWTASVKAERQEALANRLAEEAKAEAEKQAIIDRVEKLAQDMSMLEGFTGYLDIAELRWQAKSDRMHDSRYSAMHVLQLLEYVVKP